MPPSKPLTEPQARLLARVREAGELRQNGRARSRVEALEARGLIEYDYDLQPHGDAHGNIKSMTEVFIIRPLPTDDWQPAS